jgi:hypothetical protein
VKNTRKWVLIGGLLLLIFHLPFLESDPDRFISASRDANTDEGQYTYQIRNFIHHGEMAFMSSGCMAVSPLFSMVLVFPFKAFGAHLFVARSFLLLLSFAILLLVLWKDAYWQKFFVAAAFITFLQYYVFHYAHFALPEFLSCTLIFASIIISIEGAVRNSALKSAFVSSAFVLAACYLKLQFLSAIVILPLSLFVLMWLKGSERKTVFVQFKYTVLFEAIFLLAVFTCWYLPNQEFFDYIRDTRFLNVLSDAKNLKSTLHFNWLYVLQSNFLNVYSYAFIAFLLPGIILFFKSGSLQYKAAFIFLGAWLASESYKLMMLYLPSRYLLSLIFPMSLFIALVIHELIFNPSNNTAWKTLKVAGVFIALCFAIMNSAHYVQSFSRRTFEINKINSYLAGHNMYKKTVIGSWAPSLTWESKSFTFPLWNNIFFDKDIFSNHNPSVIIAEEDEKDSNQAFRSKNITLDALADSVKSFEVNGYRLKLYWMKSNNKEK